MAWHSTARHGIESEGGMARRSTEQLSARRSRRRPQKRSRELTGARFKWISKPFDGRGLSSGLDARRFRMLQTVLYCAVLYCTVQYWLLYNELFSAPLMYSTRTALLKAPSALRVQTQRTDTRSFVFGAQLVWRQV